MERLQRAPTQQSSADISSGTAVSWSSSGSRYLSRSRPDSAAPPPGPTFLAVLLVRGAGRGPGERVVDAGEEEEEEDADAQEEEEEEEEEEEGAEAGELDDAKPVVLARKSRLTRDARCCGPCAEMN